MDNILKEQIKEYCKYLQDWNLSYEEYAKSVGLSYTNLMILDVIFKTENCTQKIISESLFLPKQTVNGAVTYFYKKGFLKLKELPENRRIKTIHFTDSGKKYAESILLKVRETEYKAMEKLTKEEREALLKMTKSFTEHCINVLRGY